jgi:hypothetical protein
VQRSSETSVLTRTAGHNVPEDHILRSRYLENLKSYKFFQSASRQMKLGFITSASNEPRIVSKTGCDLMWRDCPR